MTGYPMDDKTVVITGGNSGIGLETAVALAGMGAKVVLGCRSPKRGAAAVEEIRTRSGNDEVTNHTLDLADLVSVRSFAAEVSGVDRIDVLINNAGLVLDERHETAQGFEATFGTNHIGPFLLTDLLLDQVRAAPAGRIVNLASFGHAFAIGGIKWSDIDRRRKYREWRVYGDSKLANILHAEGLAQRLQGSGAVANSVHPGPVSTNFGREGDTGGWTGKLMELQLGPVRSWVLRTPEEGARTSIHVAASPQAGAVNGGYWSSSRQSRPRPWTRHAGDVDELWTRTERMIAAVS